jgi:hypothetical protein
VSVDVEVLSEELAKRVGDFLEIASTKICEELNASGKRVIEWWVEAAKHV